MEKLFKNKKTKFLILAILSFILLLIIFLSPKMNTENLNIGHKYATTKIKGEAKYYLAGNSESEEDSDDMCKYLSDIEYIKDQSKVEWGSITLDSNLETQHNHGLITLLVENKENNKLDKRFFLKGISAHATSTLVYDISKYNYEYFSTYMGVDESRGGNGNGVKFYIYTKKENDEDWVLRTEQNPKAVKGNEKALYQNIDIRDVKYIKLYCDNNGNNSYDHAVYGDAKLYNEGYEESTTDTVDFSTVEEYDKILKEKMSQVEQGKTVEEILNDSDYELTLLRRTFVNNVGYDLLKAIVNQSKQNNEAVSWLMGDIENLRLYVLGGEPDGGSYYNSIKELGRLYKKYKEDFKDETLTKNPWVPGQTKGDVYKKMAISLSLTHATKVGYWAQIDHPSNRSDSLKRYQIYKDLYDEGKFIVAREVEKNEDGSIKSITPILNEDGTPRQDHTPWFEALQVEEMRYVMNNITDDEELKWLNEYTQKRIDDNPKQEEKYLQPHTYIAYVWPNFENPIFHDETKKQEWDELFEGIFSKYNVTYSTENDHVYKAWMSMRNSYGTGAVCGGISKLGTHIRAAHGTPASVVGQPGHAAIIYYRKDKDGKGYWTLDNDVSGWAQSGKSEKLGTRMPLGWGSDSYVNGYAATYIMLSQEALNDNENYEKSEKIIMSAKLYDGNLEKQEQLYREALKVQNINIDAWWGLINVYNQYGNKTDEDYFNLAKELGDALVPFPLPMKNLLDQIKPNIKNIDYSFRFTLLETELLNKGKTFDDTSRVYQPSITKTVANYLLGQTDTTLATFSFDGLDAGKIVLSSRFDDSGVRWDYNLSGKDSINEEDKWNEVYFKADEPHKWQLSKEEIESITADNDIYVHIVGTDYSESNVYKIDIEDQALLSNLYANDLENRIVGVDLNTQWRYSENDNWKSYNIESPDLTGDKKVQIRQSEKGNKMASPVSDWYTFTEDNQPEDRKYIRVSDLEIEDFSTESIDKNRPFYAPNAIDGNINTMWHTDFRYNVIKEKQNPYLTIKLNRPRYISAVEFVQRKYKVDDPDAIKNLKVYVSEDGEQWKEAGKIENCTTDKYNELKDITFEESVYGQYVKLYIDTHNMFASIAMVNLFEDTSKIDKTIPTAGIYYSTKEPTSDYVIARLENPSTEITVTNNDGNDTYVFTDNGDFTFEFEDKNGNKGSATAYVDWIDKNSPTADVEYQLDGDKNLFIILDGIDEDVYLLDKDNNKINYIEVKEYKEIDEDGQEVKVKKVSRVSYLDNSGNVNKIVELDKDGNITKIIYKNTTGRVPSVDTYVNVYTYEEKEDENVGDSEGDSEEDSKKLETVITEEYYDEEGNPVTIEENEQEILSQLQKVKTSPLEYTFEGSGNYEFKLLDKASNITYKTIKVDYLENNNIMASDISYDISKLTNQDVVATINPYMINTKGEKLEVEIVNNSSNNKYTFKKDGQFAFKYKDPEDTDNVEVVEHVAKVNWIDKIAPTATIKYDIKNNTDEPVTASLTDESEEIIITNNNMSKHYTFTSNDEFTFQFEDKAGNKATALAKVSWIKENQNSGETNKDDDTTGEDQNSGSGSNNGGTTGSESTGESGNSSSSSSGNQGGNGSGTSGGSGSTNGSTSENTGEDVNENVNQDISESENDNTQDEKIDEDTNKDSTDSIKTDKILGVLPKTGTTNVILYITAGIIIILVISFFIRKKLKTKRRF